MKEVLDKGFVRLVDTMPQVEMIEEGFSSLDAAIVDAARASYKRSSGDVERDKKLINYLIEHNHGTPLEMVTYKFQLKAPVMVWWHVNRHRMQSLNLQSGRYVEYPEDDFYLPNEWRGQAKSNKQASEGVVEQSGGITNLVGEHFNKSKLLYDSLLSQGVAREQARLVLPGFAMYHTGISQMNLRAFTNFVNLRDSPHAQFETREYAKAMKELVAPTIPYTSTRLW